MRWWLFWWPVLCLVKKETHTSNHTSNGADQCFDSSKCTNNSVPSKRAKSKSDIGCCLKDVNKVLASGNIHNSIKAIKSLETFLEDTEVNDTTSISVGALVAVLYKPNGSFTGLEISSNETEAVPGKVVTNRKVSVQLPRELDAESNNTIVFCMVTWPETNGTIKAAPGELYENRLVGLSVSGKNVVGLQNRVNITINVTTVINETQEPQCVFFNLSTGAQSSDGCQTEWDRGHSHITCSCDHLTFFGVLMVTSSISTTDKEILSYITLIGCSFSLFGLIVTVLLVITNRQVRADVSMKVHISLAIALILLNVHFLPSQKVAALSSTGLCIYMAVALHYSLLASFSWMALEGFHLYILLVRVFNIYINRYLLKLSVVGWGIPAVIVSLVVIIDRNAYGSAPLDSSNSNDTTVCYIKNNTVKMVTTMGVFGLVFIFNVIMLGVTVRRVISLHQNHKSGQSNCNRAKRDVFTLLGVTTLLGITWGLVFFWWTPPGLYLFCILNSLQGFFIFLWFLMSLRKMEKPAATTSHETHSTS